MHIRNTLFKGRKAWELDNGKLSVTMLEGGGHIAGLTLHETPRVNPFWIPVWKMIEPWEYRAADAGKYAIKLLSCICGHNLCLGFFGDPSEEEKSAGLGTHGEAPIVRWKALRKSVSKRGVSLTSGCDLPVAQMAFTRTLTTPKGSDVVAVREVVENRSRRDLPFTICEHVTLGPPFLEKGVTVFDMPATKGHTFPKPFGNPRRLKADAEFVWPCGPGARGGKVDMRMIGREYRASGDFSAHLMDPRRDDAWFSAVNPRLGVLIAYVWKRSDFPWVGNWEENYARKENPWAGKSLTRGMEFTNSPFPVGLRQAVSMGKFHGQPTYRWLPAAGKVQFDYRIVAKTVPAACRGVSDIRPGGAGFEIDLVV